MNKRPQPASGKAVSENTASNATDEKEAQKKKAMETWGHEKKLKFTYKEQKEYETIEADIEKLENRLSEIDDEMVKNATNFGKLNELTKEKENLEEQLMEKWIVGSIWRIWLRKLKIWQLPDYRIFLVIIFTAVILSKQIKQTLRYAKPEYDTEHDGTRHLKGFNTL